MFFLRSKNHEPMKGFSNKDHLSGTIDMSSKQIISAVGMSHTIFYDFSFPILNPFSESQKNAYRVVNDQVRGATCPKCSAAAAGGKFCTNCGERLFTEGMLK